MNMEPMLATTLDYEYDEDLQPKFTEQQFQWDAEDKLDGVRLRVKLEYNCNDSLALTRVKGKHTGEYANKLGHLAWARTDGLVERTTILDGEGKWGKNSRSTMEILGCHSNESLLRQARTEPLKYTAFDILFFNGVDVRFHTFERRRLLLTEVMTGLEAQFPGEVNLIRTGPARYLWRQNAEGIMLKEPGHYYQDGKRSPSWLKVKRFKKYIAVVTGYTAGKQGKTGQMVGLMGSLWLGMLDHRGILIPVGAAGTGFDMNERSPLAWPVRTVVEVASSDVTEDGKLWHPRFLKRRPDLRVEDAQLSQLGV
jgi:bifunctional non-homologous end joining protein LigD